MEIHGQISIFENILFNSLRNIRKASKFMCCNSTKQMSVRRKRTMQLHLKYSSFCFRLKSFTNDVHHKLEFSCHLISFETK